MRQDGKDACLKEVLAGVFEQAGVALAPDNFVVNAPRFLATSHLADEPLVPFPNGEFRDRRRLGNWKEVGAFEREIRVIAKDLFDVRGSHLRADTRVDLDRLDRERARERDGRYLANRRRRAAAALAGDDNSLSTGNRGAGRENEEKKQKSRHPWFRSQWHGNLLQEIQLVGNRTP